MERCGEKGLTHLSIEALDELVVAAHKKVKHRRRKGQNHHQRDKKDRSYRKDRDVPGYLPVHEQPGHFLETTQTEIMTEQKPSHHHSP